MSKNVWQFLFLERTLMIKAGANLEPMRINRFGLSAIGLIPKKLGFFFLTQHKK